MPPNNPGLISTSDRAKKLGKLGGQKSQIKRREFKHKVEHAALALAAATLDNCPHEERHQLALELCLALQLYRLLPQPGAPVWRKSGASSE